MKIDGLLAQIATAALTMYTVPGTRVSRGLLGEWVEPQRYRRSRGAQAKPKKRQNRLTIGKRVRRKHRRSA